MSCMVIEDVDRSGHPLTAAAASAAGLHPYTAADLQAAYRLPSERRGHGQTIAIVDAYTDPKAAADLAVYRKVNHLPGCAAMSCFHQVNQRGGASLPPPPPASDSGWTVEESLDVDMASAICPYCRILLVYADNDLVTNLGLAENEAARLGANVISNSYGTGEYPSQRALARDYDHPGIVITAATGDYGFEAAGPGEYGISVPAAYATVIAAGGTTLYPSHSTRGWAETAWQGAGSGCSTYVAKPPWQHDRLCGERTIGDTAAVADPHTPVALYDTYQNAGGWLWVGGTSVASPIIAGVYALAGNGASISAGAYLYAHHRNLFDVTAGSNGSCGGSYLCTARPGYDGPTGWGTPHGTGAF
jgi:subtilase family serine protease